MNNVDNDGDDNDDDDQRAGKKNKSKKKARFFLRNAHLQLARIFISPVSKRLDFNAANNLALF